MYPRSLLCEEAKIKQRTPLKKKLCEIGEDAIWDPDSLPFSDFCYTAKYWNSDRIKRCKMVLALKVFCYKCVTTKYRHYKKYETSKK